MLTRSVVIQGEQRRKRENQRKIKVKN